MTFYLIAHKVRGEEAWDVATKMEMSDGDWWIIPTSGRRAYPFYTTELVIADVPAGPMPADLRDHYEVSRDPPARDYTNRATQTPVIPTLEDI